MAMTFCACEIKAALDEAGRHHAPFRETPSPPELPITRTWQTSRNGSRRTRLPGYAHDDGENTQLHMGQKASTFYYTHFWVSGETIGDMARKKTPALAGGKRMKPPAEETAAASPDGG